MKESIKSDKGYALYYVMIIMIVITLVLSGVMYMSLSTGRMTANLRTETQARYNCDSALTMILGQIKAEVVGKADCTGASSFVNITAGSRSLFVPYGINADNYYFPFGDGDAGLFDIADVISGSNASVTGGITPLDGKYGFDVEDDKANFLIRIKDITAISDGVSVSADIVIKYNEENSVTDAYFENYTVSSVITQTEEASEGGNS